MKSSFDSAARVTAAINHRPCSHRLRNDTRNRPSRFWSVRNLRTAALRWTGIDFAVHRPKHGRIMLSTSHPFVQWMKRVGTACAQGRNSLPRDEGWRLFTRVDETTRNSSSNIGDLVRHINVWRTHPNLPPDLLPPDITHKPDMFRFWPDKKSDYSAEIRPMAPHDSLRTAALSRFQGIEQFDGLVDLFG